MKTIQEMLQELSQCIVTVSGEFRFRTNWNGGKIPQPEPEKPDLDVFDPNVPFCIENVGDVPASIQYNTKNTNIRISKDYKTWNDYTSGIEIELNPTDRVYIKSDYVLDESGTPKFHFTNANGTRLRARGNIASLLYGTGDEYITKYTIAAQYCYKSMFDNCTSLIQAPELPATTLASNCYNSMFSGCTDLTQAPRLSATTLADYCYRFMFNGCANLTQAPELPATTLADYCYDSMFQHCISLTQAPNLPAKTLTQSCYIMMFRGCTGLTQAPELPATILAKNCYDSMFANCTSLTQVPELPVITLVDYCYDSMFSGCTSLTQAPELPATTLAYGCYSYMFEGCTGLTQAPELPATTLADYCYYSMFNGCTSLNYIKCLATDTSATDCTQNWLSNVAQTGTFECDNKKYFTVDSPNGIPSGWTITEINPDVEKPDLDTFDPNVPFCIENVGDVPVEIGLYNNSTAVRDQCVYSYDLKTWQNYKILTTESISTPIVLSNNGDRVYIKASFHDVAPKFGATRFYLLNESANTKIRARGNIASLNDVNENEYKLNYLTAPKYCYYEMFKDCTSLVQGPDLPATNLETQSYFRMFYGCTSLVQAPNLPAEVLTESCYDEMFHKCTGLVTPPTISAKTLANQCCRSMFADCTSLTQAPALPATTLAEYCYDDMFARCTSLTQAPELPATILAPACYYGMFAYCTSLTQAPELPATTLANICCLQMFCYCASLTQAPELPATTLADGCYKQMFEGCANLTQAPELPAKWLHEYCYQWMFDGCTKLNYVKCLATDGFTSTGCTTGWLRDVSATGTFECDNKKYFTVDSPNGIPSGWTITEINPAQPEPEKPDLDTFDPNVPFCIENVGDVPASIQYNTQNTNIRISKDYKTWNDYTTGDSIALDPTDRVYIKSDYVKDTGSNPRFVFNGDGARLRARGNIASLIYGTNDAYVNKYTSTEEHCYYSMFRNCKSLVQAPELPATTLSSSCYQGMFYGCASLTQAPELPAATLAHACYNLMFINCTSLNQAPELPATTLADSCYKGMFYGCAGLTQAPELPAINLNTRCYSDMFYDCTKLTNIPNLPATTLAEECYYNMFLNCTSITITNRLPAMILAPRCYDGMFYSCKSLVQAPELPATTLAWGCYSQMFANCKSLVQAPELPATTLTGYCYYAMFQHCKKLNYVKCLATDTSATDCTRDWLTGVRSKGTFESDNKKYFTVDSPNGIPKGWTITEINPDPEKPDLDTFDPNVPFCIEKCR